MCHQPLLYNMSSILLMTKWQVAPCTLCAQVARTSDFLLPSPGCLHLFLDWHSLRKYGTLTNPGSQLHGTRHTARKAERCQFPITPSWRQLAMTCWLCGYDTAHSGVTGKSVSRSSCGFLGTAEVLTPLASPSGDGTKASDLWSNLSANVSSSKAPRGKSCFPWLELDFLALKRILSIYRSKIKHFHISARSPGEIWFY